MNGKISLPCMNGFTLWAYDGNIIIVSRRNEETIPVSKIQSFSLKEPHGLSQGQIVFNTAQAATAGVNLGFGISAAFGAEKSFFFTKANLEAAKQLRDYVTNYEATLQQPTVTATAGGSAVEEIRGLKSLLDDGIITQEEFDAKKRQLLGI